MDRNEMLSKILKGEYIMTTAVINGHKASDGDKFKDLRTEVEILRCIYFDSDPRYCKQKYRK